MKTGVALAAALALILGVMASGCVQQNQGPVCNPPYIVKGYDCCLDQNDNRICDSDEQVTQTYCGDGGCDADENCSSCPQDCRACPLPVANDTAKEIKTTVYEAVRKYVPKAAAGSFEYEPRPNTTAAFDTWHYPGMLSGVNTSRYVVYVSIKDYHFGLGGPQSVYDRLPSQSYGSGETYIEKLEIGSMLVTDRTTAYAGTPGSGKYEYSVEFTCNRTYDIGIYTWDFYGPDVIQLYRDYDIDRGAIKKAVNDILNTC